MADSSLGVKDVIIGEIHPMDKMIMLKPSATDITGGLILASGIPIIHIATAITSFLIMPDY